MLVTSVLCVRITAVFLCWLQLSIPSWLPLSFCLLQLMTDLLCVGYSCPVYVDHCYLLCVGYSHILCVCHRCPMRVGYSCPLCVGYSHPLCVCHSCPECVRHSYQDLVHWLQFSIGSWLPLSLCLLQLSFVCWSQLFHIYRERT